MKHPLGPATSTRHAAARWPRTWLRVLLPTLAVLLGGAGGTVGVPGPARDAARAEWVVSQIEAKNANLQPAVRAEKYAAMAEGVLAFFRSTNYVYWADFAHSPLLGNFGSPTTRIWLQGDAHAENIGALANSQGAVVYDLDDFDEVVIGDYQLDLWRLGISLILFARENGGFSAADQDALLDALSLSYINTLGSYRGNNNELTQIYTAGNTPSPLSDFLADIASHASRTRMLGRHTTTETGTRTFDFSKPDILPVPASFVQAVEAAMPAYTATLAGRVRYMPGYFRVKDVAQRVGQGLGSRGLPRYYVLVEGPTLSQDDDRILDVKLQGYPSAWPYIDPTVREQMSALFSRDQAMRTVLGNRVLGYRVDEHLGTMALLGDSYGVRERTPARGTFEVRELVNVQRASRLAEVWGAVLATAHARADQDSSPLIPYDFERETLNKIGNQRAAFVVHVRQVALRYAAQVEADYRSFVDTLARPAPAPGPAPSQTANNKPTAEKI